MKSSRCLRVGNLLCAAGLLLSGCLLRHGGEPPRRFVLTPIPASGQVVTGIDPLSVGVRQVKMFPYLLPSSMVVRKSANEIDYLESALWAERLNQGFQRVLAADLAAVLPSDRVYLSAWERDQAAVRLAINVEQFDVDLQGRGTLIADWVVLAPDSEKPLTSGRAHVTRTGAAPRGNPETIATTLSVLAGEFSQELAQALRHCTH